VRAGYIFGGRHSLSVLVAPLRIHASGRSDRPITFRDRTFAANSDLDARFRFDSYRLTYRYDFYRADSFTAGAGVTAKIRDASIRVSDASGGAEKSNTGFVPLLNFRAEWVFSSPLSALFEGDALAAPQGRAEDLLLALQYRASESVSIKAGYRILEGGANNDEVYTFSMFHYAVMGMTLFF
jgi:hypothetical protein